MRAGGAPSDATIMMARQLEDRGGPGENFSADLS